MRHTGGDQWPTWRYSGPLQAPPWPFINTTCVEDDPDSAGVTGEVGGKVGPTGLDQQGCPVSFRQSQVVETLAAADVSMHIKGSELDGYGTTLRHHYDVRPVQVTGVVGGVVWGGQETWGKGELGN